MSFGFRLDTVELRAAGNRRPANFVQRLDQQEWRYLEHAYDLLDKRLRQKNWGDPRPRVVDDDFEDHQTTEEHATEVVFRIDDVGWYGRHLTLRVSHGRPTGHGWALAELDSDDVDISDKAPTRDHRALFVEPTGEGRAVLAVEVINNACPSGRIVKWLTHWSREEADSSIGVHELSPASWKLSNPKPLGDQDHLAKFVDESESQSLTLVKHHVTEDRKRAAREIVVTAEATTSNRSIRSIRLARNWVHRAIASDDVDSNDELRELAAIVGPEIASMDFDDGFVTVVGDDGRTKQVRPGDLAGVFTYPLGPIALDDDEFYGEVRRAILRLEHSAALSIDWDS